MQLARKYNFLLRGLIQQHPVVVCVFAERKEREGETERRDGRLFFPYKVLIVVFPGATNPPPHLASHSLPPTGPPIIHSPFSTVALFPTFQ